MQVGGRFRAAAFDGCVVFDAFRGVDANESDAGAVSLQLIRIVSPSTTVSTA
ncbi:hypothetical protein [Arthrobacter sp. ISL-95]|uniref:hypothetical protein n=1 Tax=Arthrobacter sp. ISL-95 TaxID=2819116 RepID=UPI002852E723|nr:hypothetical protein [Arthrobacter sp. ISL-95]